MRSSTPCCRSRRRRPRAGPPSRTRARDLAHVGSLVLDVTGPVLRTTGASRSTGGAPARRTLCACASPRPWPSARRPSSPRPGCPPPPPPVPARSRPTSRRTSRSSFDSLTGTTLVLVHGFMHLTAANDAVAATGMTRSITFRRIDVVGAVGTKAQIQAVRSQPDVEVRRGRRPSRSRFFQEDLQPGHARARGDPDADRRRRQPADRQGRLGGCDRLRRRPDPPLPPRGGRQQRGRREPQDGVRRDASRCARCRRCRRRSTPTPFPWAATAPT